MYSKLLRPISPLSTLVSSSNWPLAHTVRRPFSAPEADRGELGSVHHGGAADAAKASSSSTTSDSGAEGKKKSGGWWSKWSGENAWKLGLIFLSSSGLIAGSSIVYLWGPPPNDEDGNPIVDKYSDLPVILAYCRRAFDECLSFNQSIRDPISESLLPDMVKPPYYQPPYTLVVEMNGILVHPDWTFKTGWRFKKRPALEVFLQSVSPYFEVVCFTQEVALSAAPVLQQIDPKGQFLHYRLFRESTRYRGGEHIKDLSCLNRPLNRVIVVDWNRGATQLQPRNALHVAKWRGDDDDKELLDLAAFLRMMAMSGVDDVRPVLDYYREFEAPLDVFRENQNKMMEEQAKRQEETAKKPSPSRLVSGLGFRGLTKR